MMKKSLSTLLAIILFLNLFTASNQQKRLLNVELMRKNTFHDADAPSQLNYPSKRYSDTFMYGAINVSADYYAAITLGSNKQVFLVIVDTGSASLAVPSKDCKAYTKGSDPQPTGQECHHAENFYDQKSSKHSKSFECGTINCTCIDGTCGFTLGYGDSSFLQGTLVQDDFSIAGLTAKTIFGAFDIESEDFGGTEMDGIMGLAYNRLDPNAGQSPFDQLVAAGQVEDSFAMCMGPNGGILTLGGYDPNYSDGPMRYTPIKDETFYVVQMNDILVGNTSLDLPSSVYNDNFTIIDSGTTWIYLDDDIYRTLVDIFMSHYCPRLPKGMQSLCDCNGQACIFNTGICFQYLTDELLQYFPNISLVFQDIGPIVITPEQYFEKFGQGHCFAIGGADLGVSVILGDTLMQAYNVHFDRKNKQIGFAPVANCTSFAMKIEMVDGDHQEGNLGWTLKQPLRVQATYENGLPAIGVIIQFEGSSAHFEDGGKSITDNGGISTMDVALLKPGTHHVTAHIVGFNQTSVTFTMKISVVPLVLICIGSAVGFVILIVSAVLLRRYLKKRAKAENSLEMHAPLLQDSVEEDEDEFENDSDNPENEILDNDVEELEYFKGENIMSMDSNDERLISLDHENDNLVELEHEDDNLVTLDHEDDHLVLLEPDDDNLVLLDSENDVDSKNE